MQKINRKVITGTIAASLLLAATGLLQSSAFAAETSETAATPASTATAEQPGKWFHEGRGGHRGGHGFGGVNLIQETATLLGIEESAVKADLASGKTLVQIAEAGKLSKDTYIAKLVELQTKAIDEKLEAGAMTEDQATTMKSNLKDRITQAVESTKPIHGKGHGPGRGYGEFASPGKIAELLGMTEAEVKTALDGGKSLVELAQTKGISEEQLIAKLKDAMTDSLKRFVNGKRPAPDKDSTVQ